MISIIIAILMSLGQLNSAADWDKLSTEQQQEYQSTIIIDVDIIGL